MEEKLEKMKKTAEKMQNIKKMEGNCTKLRKWMKN